MKPVMVGYTLPAEAAESMGCHESADLGKLLMREEEECSPESRSWAGPLLGRAVSREPQAKVPACGPS